MSGFFKKLIEEGIKYTAKGASKGGGAVIKAAPIVTRPIREFSRAAITGGPRAVPLGQGGGTVTTIYASTRAGIQVNHALKATSYAAVMKSPRLALGAAKMGGRIAFKDVFINPVYGPATRAFGHLTLRRVQRGVSTGLEKYVDRMILGTNKILQKYGVAPTTRGDAASIARYAIYAGIYEGINRIAGGDGIIAPIVETVAANYERAKAALPARLPELVPVSGPEPVPIVPAPIVVPADRVPVIVLPPAPPVRPTPPVIQNQPIPQRRLR